MKKLSSVFLKVMFRKSNINATKPDRKQRFENSINSLSLSDFFIHHASCRRINQIREYFGRRYLRGNGIEIGAQALPLKVDTYKAKVLYVDRISAEENYALHGGQLDKFVHVDILSEADSLQNIPTKSLDFVIANHIIEHLPDPIAALNEWLRVLNDNGVLFLTIPNKRANEYDFERLPVAVDHIIDDFENKTKEKKEEHWREFVTVVDGIPQGSDEFEKFLENEYRVKDNRIHMHVFDEKLSESVLSYVKNKLYPEVALIDAFYLTYSFELILLVGKKMSNDNHSFELHTNQLRNLSLLIGKTLLGP